MLELGLGLRLGQLQQSALPPEAETTALLARMSVVPSSARQSTINDLVAALKAGGIWAKLDVLWVLAAHDAQAARLNWITAAYDLTAYNSPNFTTDRGYKGDAASAYLGSGFSPYAGNGTLGLNDAAYGVFVAEVQTMSYYDFGTTSAPGQFVRIRGKTATLGQASNNVGAMTATAADGKTGPLLYVTSRTSASKHIIYRDGVANATAAATATGKPSEIYLLRSGPSTYVDSRVGMAFAGRGLSALEVSALNSAVVSYMQAVGVL